MFVDASGPVRRPTHLAEDSAVWTGAKPPRLSGGRLEGSSLDGLPAVGGDEPGGCRAYHTRHRRLAPSVNAACHRPPTAVTRPSAAASVRHHAEHNTRRAGARRSRAQLSSVGRPIGQTAAAAGDESCDI